MENNKYYDFGYAKFGPLLWGYSHWLLDNIVERRINKVFFFSRDGLIMQKAFNLISGSEKIECHYLEVSRRSLRVPVLWKDLSVENLLTMLSPSKAISIQSIFDGIGLPISSYVNVIHKYGFSTNTVFYRSEILKNQNLMSMYKELSVDIKNNSLIEYELLKKYLTQNNINGKFAVVDIGWSGGMQRFLQTTLNTMGIDNEIFGFYTGIASYYKRNISTEKLNLNGYLFDFSHDKSAVDIRSSYVGLYELLFLETKGSVKNYTEDKNGKIVAVRYPYEYADGKGLLNEAKCIGVVQTAALDYVKTKENDNAVIPSKKELCKPLINAGARPSSEALKLFADFRFFDEGVCNYLAKPKGLVYYLFHPNRLKKDFYASRWKTGFLRKLFRVPISYQSLYNFLKRL